MVEDSTFTWLKCFHDGCHDEARAVVNNRTSDPASGSIKRASARSIAEERRYLEHTNDINDFIPTQDMNSIWLQCFADGCRNTEHIDSTATIQRDLVPNHNGLAQAELDHDYLCEQGNACGMKVGKWMKMTGEMNHLRTSR